MKAIAYTVLLVIAVFVAFKTLPPYVSEYQLSNKMDEVARFAVVNRYSEDQIRDNIFKEVQDLDIPAKREDIKVSATQQVVKISLDYTVPVDLLVYSTELHFSPSSENKSIM
jgi:predicted membrane protein